MQHQFFWQKFFWRAVTVSPLKKLPMVSIMPVFRTLQTKVNVICQSQMKGQTLWVVVIFTCTKCPGPILSSMDKQIYDSLICWWRYQKWQNSTGTKKWHWHMPWITTFVSISLHCGTVGAANHNLVESSAAFSLMGGIKFAAAFHLLPSEPFEYLCSVCPPGFHQVNLIRLFPRCLYF